MHLTSVASPHPPVLCCAKRHERHMNKKGKEDKMSMRGHSRRTQSQKEEGCRRPRALARS